MKISTALAGLCLMVFSGLAAFSQTTPFAGAKVAVIDTEVLSDPKAGITKLVKAIDGIAAKHKSHEDELTAAQKQLEALATEIGSGKLQGQALADKRQQADALQRQLTYNQDKYKREFDKDLETATTPVFTEINTAIQAYAKSRGIDMVIDVAKVPGAVLILNNSVDITDAFIKDFNTKSAAIPVK
jgi:Skp family chaperone for outer membrane proteins